VTANTQENGRVPDAEEFRSWLIEVLDVLGIAAFRLASESGAAANSVSKFVGRDQLDIRMNTAKRLVEGSRKLAISMGKTLPPLPGGEDVAFEEGATE